MRSIKEVCVVGVGPSSSHTMGPLNACKYVLGKYTNIQKIFVHLYGSLAKTGKGHMTDYIIDVALKGINHKIIFDKKKPVSHPNTMEIITVSKYLKFTKDSFVSLGGGSLIVNGDMNSLPKEIYPHKSMNEILSYCKKENISLLQYVYRFEDKDIKDYFVNVVNTMNKIVEKGIKSDEKVMPGQYGIVRKAKDMYQAFLKLSPEEKMVNPDTLVAIASIAASEENACGHESVCCPTCGSSGVLPGVIVSLRLRQNNVDKIAEALMVGALIGIVCKQNGSISGAECGCQAEIGVAAAIGAASLAAADGLSNEQIVNAAELVIENSLGLTCDAIEGRVQIPCINRNAIFALKARDAYLLAKVMPIDSIKVSLDDIIVVMKKTGQDLDPGYRETAGKGLAKYFRENK